MHLRTQRSINSKIILKFCHTPEYGYTLRELHTIFSHKYPILRLSGPGSPTFNIVLEQCTVAYIKPFGFNSSPSLEFLAKLFQISI